MRKLLGWLHRITARYCVSEDCPCYFYGYMVAQDTVSEWHRPHSY